MYSRIKNHHPDDGQNTGQNILVTVLKIKYFLKLMYLFWFFVHFKNLINAGNVEHIKNVQSHIFILHQHVAVIPVTIIRLSHNYSTTNIQIIVQKLMINPFGVKFDAQIKCNSIHFCTIICILIVFLQ